MTVSAFSGSYRRRALALAVAVGLAAATALVGATSASATASTTHSLAGVSWDLGPSPIGVGNCSFANADASLYFVNGNGSMHFTSNANGDWGGINLEGTAYFQEDAGSGPVQLYLGHAHFWSGGGNNTQGQSENGFTLSFNGVGVSDPTATLQINISGGGTVSAHGVNWNQRLSGSVTCS